MTAASQYASKVRSRARDKGLTSGDRMGQVLDDVADAVSNLEGAWPAVAEVWAARQQRVFATDSSGRWAPLKAVTILRKQREGSPLATLRESSLLMHEVTSTTPRSSGAHFVVLGPQRGAGIEYAKFHLRGSGVPQRNPVPRLTGPERTEFIETIRDYYRPADAPRQGRTDVVSTLVLN